jgi:hypothetical protein
MKHFIASLLFLFFVNIVYGQNKVTITLVGSVTNFSTSEKLFGATLYMMQNGKTVAKSISDETGRYNINGFVLIEQPIDLLVSKPGYASKKVLFDIKTLKISNGKSTNLQLLEELIIELYENRTGANLSFTKTDYAEKFTWDQSVFIAKPDEKYKSAIDKKVTEEYAKVENNGVSKDFVSRGDIANKNKEFEKAVAYYDSAIVATPKDSTIKLKKDNVLNTIKNIQEEDTKKANYNSKKSLAENALNSGDLVNAEKTLKAIQLEFPGDPYATNQLAKISVVKNQQDLDNKSKVEADKLIAQANTLKNSKKYEDAIAKLQQAITLSPSKKEDLNKEISTIKSIQSDVNIEEQLNKDLKNVASLLKDKKYDEAIIAYKNIDQSIAKLSNQPLIDKYSSLSQQGAKSVLDKKNLEGEEFKKQLQKAQDNYDKGPAFYGDAEKILKGDPMKSRMSDPDVKQLSEQIVKMKDFYKQKNEAYKDVKNKKNNEALTKLKATRDYATKLGNTAPQNELTKLKNSIDSLESILKPQNVGPNVPQTNNSNSSGIQLKAPGELITNNPSDVFNELAENIDAKKAAPFENITEIKNEIDKEADFNKKLNASRQEDDMENIQDRKTEIELKAIEQSKIPIQLQENLDEKKRQLEVDIYNKQQVDAQQNEVQSNQIQNWKNEKDSSSLAKSIEIEQKTESDMARFQETKNTIEKNALNNQKQNELIAQSLQQTKTKTEYALFKQDSLNATLGENRSNLIQQQKDFKKENKLAANHIKDEKGVEFPWNKMTENIYKIKNKEGFVTSIITRRVVVDKNGYGIVYEQNTNELGANSFCKNGAPTTEYVWANESTGINVIEK